MKIVILHWVNQNRNWGEVNIMVSFSSYEFLWYISIYSCLLPILMMNRAGVLNQPICELAGRASARPEKTRTLICIVLSMANLALIRCHQRCYMFFSVRLLCIVREGWKYVPETTSSVYLVSGQKWLYRLREYLSACMFLMCMGFGLSFICIVEVAMLWKWF